MDAELCGRAQIPRSRCGCARLSDVAGLDEGWLWALRRAGGESDRAGDAAHDVRAEGEVLQRRARRLVDAAVVEADVDAVNDPAPPRTAYRFGRPPHGDRGEIAFAVAT